MLDKFGDFFLVKSVEFILSQKWKPCFTGYSWIILWSGNINQPYLFSDVLPVWQRCGHLDHAVAVVFAGR